MFLKRNVLLIYLTKPFYRYNKKSFQMSKYKNKQLLCRQFYIFSGMVFIFADIHKVFAVTFMSDIHMNIILFLRFARVSVLRVLEFAETI